MSDATNEKTGGIFKNKPLIILISVFAVLIVVGILTT